MNALWHQLSASFNTWWFKLWTKSNVKSVTVFTNRTAAVPLQSDLLDWNKGKWNSQPVSCTSCSASGMLFMLELLEPILLLKHNLTSDTLCWFCLIRLTVTPPQRWRTCHSPNHNSPDRHALTNELQGCDILKTAWSCWSSWKNWIFEYKWRWWNFELRNVWCHLHNRF